ncbi:aldo/keto reductase [Embleya sp. NBC_00888]|uniref:aldo/keto reductase n=1 Tax=Embleya sp. NBC_00888 TaxID=2975960 RepID=UPI002F90B211
MQTVTLNNGIEMPILGFGVYQIPADKTEQAVSDALAAGYRLLDTAAAYGNEEAVGRAIKTSGIAREELFVTTKLWVQDAPAEENTRRALETSLTKLDLEHIDLYLMHQPYGDVYGQWRAMEAANREGLAKAIGVANFYPDRLLDVILNNEVTPAVDQIETHPFFQRATDHDLMRAHGVRHQSWGGFAEGKKNLFTHPVLSEIGTAHDKSPRTERRAPLVPEDARTSIAGEHLTLEESSQRVSLGRFEPDGIRMRTQPRVSSSATAIAMPSASAMLPAAVMTRAVPTMGAMATRTSCNWSAVMPALRAGSIWAR